MFRLNQRSANEFIFETPETLDFEQVLRPPIETTFLNGELTFEAATRGVGENHGQGRFRITLCMPIDLQQFINGCYAHNANYAPCTILDPAGYTAAEIRCDTPLPRRSGSHTG
jgi:hypothetical protein